MPSLEVKKIIAGYDEVGLGALAGPIVVGQFITPDILPQWWAKDIKDSKSLSESRRELVYEKIVKAKLDFFCGVVDVDYIDTHGHSAAIIEAYKRANTNSIVDERQIDGNVNYLGIKSTLIIKGDKKIKEISAASIVAKVFRDSLMKKLALVFPQYGFETHKGYGTDRHYEALKEFGPIAGVHRRSIKGLDWSTSTLSIYSDKT